MSNMWLLGLQITQSLSNRPTGTGRPQAHVTNYDPEILRDNRPISQCQRVLTEPQFQEMFDNFMKTMISSRMEKVEADPRLLVLPIFRVPSPMVK